MKRNHKFLLACTATALGLCATFWYGGAAPGLQGWQVGGGQQEEVTASPPSTSHIEDSWAVSAFPPPSAPITPAPVAPPLADQSAHQPDPHPATQPKQPSSHSEGPAESQPQGPVCTLSISCAAVLDNLDWLDDAKEELIAPDGMVYAATQLTLEDGDTAFSVLQRLTKQEGIHMEATFTPGTGSAYVEGIANLYEFDCGQRSGWLYRVNGITPGYSSSQYTLQDGDVLEWIYTCTLGEEAVA